MKQTNEEFKLSIKKWIKRTVVLVATFLIITLYLVSPQFSYLDDGDGYVICINTFTKECEYSIMANHNE